MRKLLFFFLGLFCWQYATAQPQPVSWLTYNEYRNWWDVLHYDLKVDVDISSKSISGSNTISFEPLKSSFANYLQIDLQDPMGIDSIQAKGNAVEYTKNGDHYLIATANLASENQFTIYFSGTPPVATRAPWESGFVWAKDDDGNPWVAEACQDKGASMWWPCKDYPKDEVDSMDIIISCPSNLTAVSNGRLIEVVSLKPKRKSYHWQVKNPINNYGVNLSIGNYAYFIETIPGEKGPLDATYYVLVNHVEKAKKQFLDAPRTIEALEFWFGPYPFYEDGYKLVEVPYLGMEHQSCVTYGNQYKQGYLGKDLSGTGWGLEFDFIIIHESGHEWFANNITHENVADMWIHEGFTSYSEGLYVEYFYGKEAGAEYLRGIRANIANDKPVIGNYALGEEGSGDMYYKGANMIHTLRQMVNNDAKWRATLRKMNASFYHQTVSSATVEQFLATETNFDLAGFFNTYLRDTQIPTLHYRVKRNKLIVQFQNCDKNFEIPVRLKVNGEWQTATVGTKKKKWRMSSAIEAVEENLDYYIRYKKLN